MDSRQLEAFGYVMETGSFSKAAELMHLSQPTVSAHVAALERELKLTLFSRTTKELFPTEAGRLLYEYAGKMLTLRRQAQEALRRFSSDLGGTVTLAASTIPGRFYLPRLLRAFRAQHPEVRFDTRMTDSQGAVDRVVGREAEIGFCGTEPADAKCVFQPFAEDYLVVVAPNAPPYRKYRRQGLPLQLLTQQPFVVREEGSGTRRETERYLQEMGVDISRLNIAAQAASNEAAESLVLEGRGVAILSHSTRDSAASLEAA